MENFPDKLLTLLLVLPALVSAFTIHEFAHAWAGHKLGDDTAQRQGRLSLDPIVHLDPIGCLLIVIAILFGAPLIGWAKPVPFNPRNLSHPQRDSILIAIAGPISNIIQAVFWFAALLLLRLSADRLGSSSEGIASAVSNYSPQINTVIGTLVTVCALGIMLNISLAAFNMIPLPPLDGHYVLEGLGPPYITEFFNSIRPYSMFILLGLLWTGVITILMQPARDFSYRIIGLAMGNGF